MRDLKLQPEGASRSERWLLVVAGGALLCAVAWSRSSQADVQVGGLMFVWLMVTCASLAIVRIAAYRRRAGRRESIAEQVVAALTRKAVAEASSPAPMRGVGTDFRVGPGTDDRLEDDRVPRSPR